MAGHSQAAINLLSGAFHLVTDQEADQLQGKATSGPVDPRFLESGYFHATPEAEDQLRQEQRAAFDADYAQTPVQLLLAPTYACELNCAYCYQRSFASQGLMSERQVELALDAPVGENRDRFVTLFGGEPLGQGADLRRVVKKILSASRERKLPVAVVTNGVRLVDWLDDLGLAEIKEIQVTLDGSPAQHDQRRATRSGEPTFERIANGVDQALAAGYTINLRVVLDKANLAGLTDLARIASERGWLDHGPARFKTQLGRNYELYDPYACPTDLFGLEDLYAAFVDLVEKHPEVRQFHEPSFYGLKEWVRNRDMLNPRFDACPAAKHEWGFDMSGQVYGCTATLGNPKYALGRYDPDWKLNPAAKLWQQRRVETIPQCVNCPAAPACGGGCGALAHSQRGEILAPDCKPVEKVWEQGLRYYADELEKIIQEENAS